MEALSDSDAARAAGGGPGLGAAGWACKLAFPLALAVLALPRRRPARPDKQLQLDTWSAHALSTHAAAAALHAASHPLSIPAAAATAGGAAPSAAPSASASSPAPSPVSASAIRAVSSVGSLLVWLLVHLCVDQVGDMVAAGGGMRSELHAAAAAAAAGLLQLNKLALALLAVAAAAAHWWTSGGREWAAERGALQLDTSASMSSVPPLALAAQAASAAAGATKAEPAAAAPAAVSVALAPVAAAAEPVVAASAQLVDAWPLQAPSSVPGPNSTPAAASSFSSPASVSASPPLANADLVCGPSRSVHGGGKSSSNSSSSSSSHLASASASPVSSSPQSPAGGSALSPPDSSARGKSGSSSSDEGTPQLPRSALSPALPAPSSSSSSGRALLRLKEKLRALDVEYTKQEQENNQKGMFMAFLCHELRNPLQVILANSSFLLESLSEESGELAASEGPKPMGAFNADQREMITSVNASAELMLSIVNDVLDMSRLQSGRMTFERLPIDLHFISHSILNISRSQAANKNIRLELHIDEAVPRFVVADPTRIHQLLLNLISNAIKFTSRGSVSLILKLAERPLTPTKPDSPVGSVLLLPRGGAPSSERRSCSDGIVRPSASSTALHAQAAENTAIPPPGAEKALIEIAVRDTGVGIAPENIAKLFTPYSQAKSSTQREHGGTGLGLSICTQIVKHMQGHIKVTSEVGVGSVFTTQLLLEVCDDESIRRGLGTTGGSYSNSPNLRRMIAAQQEAHAGNGAGGHEAAESSSSSEPPKAPAPLERILVVDDQPINCKLLQRMLSGLGFRIDVAHDGVEALEQIKRNMRDTDTKSSSYLCVFADLNMPRMNGWALVSHVRNELGLVDLPVIALTAESIDPEEARKAAFTMTLPKPFRKPALLGILEPLLEAKSQTQTEGPVEQTDTPATPSEPPGQGHAPSASSASSQPAEQPPHPAPVSKAEEEISPAVSVSSLATTLSPYTSPPTATGTVAPSSGEASPAAAVAPSKALAGHTSPETPVAVSPLSVVSPPPPAHSQFDLPSSPHEAHASKVAGVLNNLIRVSEGFDAAQAQHSASAGSSPTPVATDRRLNVTPPLSVHTALGTHSRGPSAVCSPEDATSLSRPASANSGVSQHSAGYGELLHEKEASSLSAAVASSPLRPSSRQLLRESPATCDLALSGDCTPSSHRHPLKLSDSGSDRDSGPSGTPPHHMRSFTLHAQQSGLPSRLRGGGTHSPLSLTGSPRTVARHLVIEPASYPALRRSGSSSPAFNGGSVVSSASTNSISDCILGALPSKALRSPSPAGGRSGGYPSSDDAGGPPPLSGSRSSLGQRRSEFGRRPDVLPRSKSTSLSQTDVGRVAAIPPLHPKADATHAPHHELPAVLSTSAPPKMSQLAVPTPALVSSPLSSTATTSSSPTDSHGSADSLDGLQRRSPSRSPGREAGRASSGSSGSAARATARPHALAAKHRSPHGSHSDASTPALLPRLRESRARGSSDGSGSGSLQDLSRSSSDSSVSPQSLRPSPSSLPPSLRHAFSDDKPHSASVHREARARRAAEKSRSRSMVLSHTAELPMPASALTSSISNSVNSMRRDSALSPEVVLAPPTTPALGGPESAIPSYPPLTMVDVNSSAGAYPVPFPRSCFPGGRNAAPTSHHSTPPMASPDHTPLLAAPESTSTSSATSDSAPSISGALSSSDSANASGPPLRAADECVLGELNALQEAPHRREGDFEPAPLPAPHLPLSNSDAPTALTPP